MRLLLSVPILIVLLSLEVGAVMPPTMQEQEASPPTAQAPTPASAPPAAPSPEAESITEEPAFHFGKPVHNAFQAFKRDMWDCLTNKKYQWAVAIPAFVFGCVALYDGCRFFQGLVSFSVAAFMYTFIFTQLKSAWGETQSNIIVVAALEGGVFAGVVAHLGWQGTQLLVGLTVGTYLHHFLESLLLLFPHSEPIVHNPAYSSVMFTFMVAMGIFVVHERMGASTVMAVLAPLFGSSLVTAVLYYIMAVCSMPAVGSAPAAVVPSVFEYWYMIAVPFQSKAVGFSAYTQGPSKQLEIDRILGIMVCLLLAAIGTYFQWRSAQKQARASRKSGWLGMVWLPKNGGDVPPSVEQPSV